MTSIRFRLPAVLGGLTLLICAMMGVSFWSTQMADRAMKAVLTDRVIPLRDLKAISDAYAVNIVDTSHKVRGGSFTFAKGIESVSASEKIIADRWMAYVANTLSDAEKKLVAEAQAQKIKTDAGVRQLLFLLNSGQLAPLAAFNDRQLYPIIEPMTAVIDKLVNSHIIEAENEARKASSTAAMTLVALWVGLACTVAFIALAMLVVFRDVLNPIERLSRSVSAIGEGDLETSVPDQKRRDEVGRMARIVESLRIGSRKLRSIEDERRNADGREIARRDALLASIRSFATHVNTTVTLVNESADAIRTTSGVMTESASETAGRASSAEMSLNGNTEAIQSMAAATSQLSSAIEEVSSQGRAIVDSIESMAARTGLAGTRLDELNDIAGKAQAAVDLIASVADQTNLLALNATIEAARAGEAGRGFAVVASEVKTLASQAARATADIRGLIATMNDTAGALQEAMAEVLGGVGDLKAVATFVKDAVDEQSKSTAAISRSIEETAQASSHILTDVQTMSRSAQETGDAAQGVSAIAVDLVTAARKLDDEMLAFAERMKAA